MWQVVAKIYHFDFPETQIPAAPGTRLSRDVMTAANSNYLRFWDAVCLRPEAERPHVIQGAHPMEFVMPNTWAAQILANCTNLPNIFPDAVPLYYALAGGPPVRGACITHVLPTRAGVGWVGLSRNQIR